jgi:predicted nucleotidyltransferase
MSDDDTIGDRGRSHPRDIFEVLIRHGVDFVVIGGVAVIGHGSQRVTQDVDFVAASDPANLARLEAALRELDAELWGVDAHLLGIDLDARTLADGGNFTLVTRAGGLDFFNEVPGGAPYDEVRARSVLVDLGDGLQVRVAGIDDLLAMKRAAGRPRDLQDIATLTHIERERRGGS